MNLINALDTIQYNKKTLKTYDVSFVADFFAVKEHRAGSFVYSIDMLFKRGNKEVTVSIPVNTGEISDIMPVTFIHRLMSANLKSYKDYCADSGASFKRLACEQDYRSLRAAKSKLKQVLSETELASISACF